MATATTNQPLMECVGGISTSQGDIGPGEKVPADHLLVKQFRDHFLPVDAPDAAKADARWRHTHGAANAEILKNAQPDYPPAPRLRLVGYRLKVGPFRFGDQVLYAGHPEPPSSKLPAKYPGLFEEVTEPVR